MLYEVRALIALDRAEQNSKKEVETNVERTDTIL